MVDCCCTGGYGYLFTCLPHLHSNSMIPVGQSARNTAICIHAYRPTCSYFMSYLFILEAPYFVFYHLDNSAGCKPRTGHNPSQLISDSLRTGNNPSQLISYNLGTGNNPSQLISYNLGTGHNPSQLISYNLGTGHNPSQLISYSLRTGHNTSQLTS